MRANTGAAILPRRLAWVGAIRETMVQSEQESSSYSRWWEFYAVRYGMGTVGGGSPR